MKRSVLASGSPARSGAGRLATTYRTPRRLQMDVIDEPAAAVSPDHVDRQHLIARIALELDPVGPQVVASGHGQRPFDDAVPGMVEILLDHGETLAQHFGIHRCGGGPTFRAPELAHPFLIFGFHRREKLGDRLVHRLRDRRGGTRVLAARGSRHEEQREHEPSLHESTPEVRTNRR